VTADEAVGIHRRAGSIRGDVKQKHSSLAGEREVFSTSSPVWEGEDVCEARTLDGWNPVAAQWRRLAKRRQALLESNPPRNSQRETHRKAVGRSGLGLASSHGSSSFR